MESAISQLTWPIVLITIAIGVAANLLTPLLKLPFELAWTHLHKPARKRKNLAKQIDRAQRYLVRLNFQLAHPKDTFLMLFRMSFAAILNLLVCLALMQFTSTSDKINRISFCVSFTLIVIAAWLSFGAFFMSRMLSDRRIGDTKDLVERFIAEAQEKMKKLDEKALQDAAKR